MVVKCYYSESESHSKYLSKSLQVSDIKCNQVSKIQINNRYFNKCVYTFYSGISVLFHLIAYKLN